MNKTLTYAALTATLAAGVSFAEMRNPVLDGQLARAEKEMPKNATRVRTDIKKLPGEKKLLNNDLAWYVVPAMSDRMRLHDTFPVDGRFAGDVRVIVAQDEFEPASFQLFSFKDMDGVTLSVTPLRTKSGAEIKKSDVDLRVIKLWLQNGNAWQSYFADVGLMLVPELALHDENMVKVDLKKQANYARLQYKDGEKHVWISAPAEIAKNGFNPVKEPFFDAKMLQPVKLERNAFKQFLLTIHAPKDQTPGVYHGAIEVKDKKGKLMASLPLAVRVLPFVLPLPRTFNNLDKPFVVSFMGGASLEYCKKQFGDNQKAIDFYTDYLISQREHGIFNAVFEQSEQGFEIAKKAGISMKPVLGHGFIGWLGLNFGGRMTFDNAMSAKNGANVASDFYNKMVGHNEIFVGYGDEQGAAFVTAHRPLLEYYVAKGMYNSCAGHAALLYKGGYLYDYNPMGTTPDNTEYINTWNRLGDRYLSFYAAQHNGSENPQFVRMQHGLLGYFSGLSMVYNYEFAVGPWNDFDSILYRPMVVSYLNAGGLVESLPYSGFREGIDDIRYVTKLKLLCRDAFASKNFEAEILARKAQQYLALLDYKTMDLNAVRAEVIDHILKLQAALK